MTAVVVNGLQAQEGETVFAFFVLRLREPRDRAWVTELLRYIAPLIPDADSYIEEMREDDTSPFQLVGLPWTPPDAGHAVEAQRRLIESTSRFGVEAAWFFQTSTMLPSVEDDNDVAVGDSTDTSLTVPVERIDFDDDDDDMLDEEQTATRESRRTVAVAGEIGGPRTGDDADEDDDELDTLAVDALPERADDDDDDDDASWSAGPPPEVTKVRFPVDGYPAIVEELDWEDFGIAVKFRGAALEGQAGVLYGFHSLWLAPYGGRFRNAAVTFDRAHNAAHFWVDRFAVPTEASQQVHHLLWVISKLDEVLPIVHARFAEASMSQKYGGLMGETSEPFVLGGNPLVAAYALGGESRVDGWIDEQREWSQAEVAAMLRELAIEIVTTGEEEHDDDDHDDLEDEEVDADRDDLDDEDADDDDEDAEDASRHVTSYVGDVLRARAAAGRLHPRAAELLLPVLDQPGRYEHRRQAVVDILGALAYRPAVPAMVRILDATTIKNSLDSIGKEDFIAATAAALGAIGDPAAIPALARVVAAPGTHNDKPRPVAAEALAACLASTPEPRSVDDSVLDQLLTTISERNDGELNAETHFAYGRLVRQLPPERRAEARRKLADADTARDDAIAMLARQAALLLASPTTPIDAPPRDLEKLLRESLTTLDYDHEYTVRNLRVALRVAAVVPDLVEADDLVWLTRFAEPDIRRSAHALLVKLGKPVPEAPTLDRVSAQALGDHELTRLIAEPHVIGRAALIAEAGRRHLAPANRAIINACHDVVSRARQGAENLLVPDTRILEAAVPVLREQPLDADVIALFDRMLRHSNVHVKWELLEDAPRDERLLGGMFHVLGEKWGWQEKAARGWLAHFQGSPAYEEERRMAGSPSLEEDVDEATPADPDDDGGGNEDDEDMN